MSRLVVRCHPCAPVAVDELEDWFEERISDLHDLTPLVTVQLTRLSQKLPSSQIDAGWLVELELPESDEITKTQLGDCKLTEALLDLVRDLRFLGLEPVILAPVSLIEGIELAYQPTASAPQGI